MAVALQKIRSCLWFDKEAEQAANFYVSVFPNSKVRRIARYGKAGQEIHGGAPGSVMTVEFELSGQPFVGLNGGPIFKFDEAISFQIFCDTQEEIDFYWKRLTEDGGQESVCGWLKDKFGLSWQVVPSLLPDMMEQADPETFDRVMTAMLGMKKLDIAEFRRAFDG